MEDEALLLPIPHLKQLCWHWACHKGIIWGPAWAPCTLQCQLGRGSAEPEDPKRYQGGLAYEFTCSFPAPLLSSQLPFSLREFTERAAPSATGQKRPLSNRIRTNAHPSVAQPGTQKASGVILRWLAPIPFSFSKPWANTGLSRQN